MKYRIMGKTGVKVSVLGYGCMRFPQKNGRVDEERSKQQILSAIAAGVNYFDTAYIYLMGQSEAVLGRVLKEAGLRDRVYIADKIPPYMVYSRKDMDKILGTCLERLQTDRIDFLLAHALNDFTGWERIKAFGYIEFLDSARKDGRIRFAGFSWHGNQEEFKKVVDDYDWDFCQIQYNYLDEHYQAGRSGLEHAAAKGLGIAIMEPLRGGSLVGRMPAEVKAVMDKATVQRSPAAWAFDWLWDQPSLHTVLSGLNEEAHIAENLRLAENSAVNCFSDADRTVLNDVRTSFASLMKVGCTGCQYCMPCPFGVDIPYAFSMYNAKHLFKDKVSGFQYQMFTSGISGGKPSSADLCRNCNKCLSKCPQHIAIPQKLKEAEKDLSVPILKPVLAAVRLILRLRSQRKAKATQKVQP